MRARLLLLVALAGCGRDLSIPPLPHDDGVRPRALTDVGVEAALAQGVLNVLWRVEPIELDRTLGHTTGVAVLRRDGDAPIDPPEDGAPLAQGRLVGSALVVFVTEDPQLTFFDDAGARRGRQYTYGIVAHNSAYLWGPVTTARGALPPLSPVAVVAGENPRSGVEVTWNLPAEGVALSALVVRGQDEEPLEAPLDQVPYAVGQQLGAGKVVYAGEEERYVDEAVRAGVEYHYDVYAVGEGFVYSLARSASFELPPPPFAAAAALPRVAGPRTQIEVEFTLERALVPLEHAPSVTVAGRAAHRDDAAGLEHPVYRFLYDVDGTEPEGEAVVEIAVEDYTGVATRRLPVSFDFTPPRLEQVVTGGGPFHQGEELSLEVTADEPMGSLLAFVLGAPMACAATPDDRVWLCRYLVNGNEPAGPQGVALAFTDRAGNGATAFQADAFEVE